MSSQVYNRLGGYRRSQVQGRANGQNYGQTYGQAYVRRPNIGSSNVHVNRKRRRGRSIDGAELMQMVNEQQVALDAKYAAAGVGGDAATEVYPTGKPCPHAVNAIAETTVGYLN